MNALYKMYSYQTCLSDCKSIKCSFRQSDVRTIPFGLFECLWFQFDSLIIALSVAHFFYDEFNANVPKKVLDRKTTVSFIFQVLKCLILVRSEKYHTQLIEKYLTQLCVSRIANR